MVEIGQVNRLGVIKIVDFGVYLDGKQLGEILLPSRYVPQGCKLSDWITVFIYRDSDDLLIATTELPLARVGECACLKVTDITGIGAFLDWGLPKDLLVPYNMMYRPMQLEQSYVVYLMLDPQTDRIVATSKLDEVLREESDDFVPKQEVDLLIWGQTDLGYKAVINNTHLGLIYKNEVFKPLRYGQRLKGYIKAIRPDNRIDLSLQQSFRQTLDELSQKIIDDLTAKGGTSKLTDKSPPEEIYYKFGVSKKAFKKTLGKLYKDRLIVIEKDQITLVKQ